MTAPPAGFDQATWEAALKAVGDKMLFHEDNANCIALGEQSTRGTPMSDRYRIGRKLGRTIYEQTGSEPSDDDRYLFDAGSREMAAKVAAALNGDDAAEVARLREDNQRLTEERDFWRDQQQFAAKVAGDIADLDEQAPALRQMLRAEKSRREATESEADRLAGVIERVRQLAAHVERCNDCASVQPEDLYGILPPAPTDGTTTDHTPETK